MGGAVKSVAKVVTSPASIVGSVLGKVPVVGPILGPAANIALGGNPFTAIAGGVFDAATGGFGGGGGGGGGGGSSSGSLPTYAAPGFNYGANTYSYGDKPYDASQYFVQGNKGVYNVLPTLGSSYNPNLAPSDPKNIEAYRNITNTMQGDPTALANFQKQFAPQTTYSNYKPIAYSDFGLTPDNTQYKLAQYASQNKNPGFVGFQTPINQPEPQTESPVPSLADIMRDRYRPVESEARGPAPRNIVPAAVTALGSFRPAEGGSAAATPAPQQQQPGAFKPVNIRTGGLASLRRK